MTGSAVCLAPLASASPVLVPETLPESLAYAAASVMHRPPMFVWPLAGQANSSFLPPSPACPSRSQNSATPATQTSRARLRARSKLRLADIFVTPERSWLEGGSASNLQTSGNTIQSCEGVPICIQATGGNGEIAPAGAHRDITITGNTVKNCPMPGILATSTIGLNLEKNTLDLNTTAAAISGLMRQAGLTNLRPVIEIQCEAVLPTSAP